MARKVTTSSLRKASKAKSGGTVQARLAALEKSLKSARRRVGKLEKCLGELMPWLHGVDGQLRELDHGYRNLSLAVGANDTGPHERPSLPSCLGILVDRGGATPIDGNAAGTFKKRRQ